jgi:hypothetical protein
MGRRTRVAVHRFHRAVQQMADRLLLSEDRKFRLSFLRLIPHILDFEAQFVVHLSAEYDTDGRINCAKGR